MISLDPWLRTYDGEEEAPSPPLASGSNSVDLCKRRAQASDLNFKNRCCTLEVSAFPRASRGSVIVRQQSIVYQLIVSSVTTAYPARGMLSPLGEPGEFASSPEPEHNVHLTLHCTLEFVASECVSMKQLGGRHARIILQTPYPICSALIFRGNPTYQKRRVVSTPKAHARALQMSSCHGRAVILAWYATT